MQRKGSRPTTAKNPRLANLYPASASSLSTFFHLFSHRQSLIMPHLTRRFTLLRAPDGSLLSPDAMRAHLRAQRARARATSGVNGTNGLAAHHFLTEEEENEIIDQLRAQAKAEGRNFEADDYRGPEAWNGGFASGTDGFGSWGGSFCSTSNNLHSLAESLGDLTSSSYPNSQDVDNVATSQISPTRRAGSDGRLFSGRSSERDMAYFRTLDKERKDGKLEAVSENPASEEEEQEGPQIVSNAFEPQRELMSDIPTHGEPAEPGIAIAEARSESGGQSSPDEAMSGDFHKAECQRYEGLEHPIPANGTDTSEGSGFLCVPSLMREEPSHGSQAKLLNSLSPEAFKRVSTALEEVFGIMAAEGSIKSASSSPMRSHFDLERRSSRGSDGRGSVSPADGAAPAETPLFRPQSGEEAEGGHAPGDSDGSSFTSAVSEHGKAKPNETSVTGKSEEEVSASVTLLQDFQIADRSLNITSFDLGDNFAIVAPPDSGPAFPSEEGRGAKRDAALTAEDGASSLGAATPIVDTYTAHPPAETPNGHQVLADNPIPASFAHAVEVDPGCDGPSNMHGDGAQAMVGGQTEAATASPLGDKAGDTTVKIADDSHVSKITHSMAGTWSLRSESHNRKSSVASSHSRNGSLGKVDWDRGSGRVLNEQSSLSSVRKHYRQHSRSATSSSTENFGLSPRSSRAMSPIPVLSRTARSPNYFPPPSSGATMENYAAGFKPPSVVSPAAIAAASATSPKASGFGANGGSSLYQSAAGRSWDSASTHPGSTSPHTASGPGQFPGLGIHAAASADGDRNSTAYAESAHSRSGSYAATSNRLGGPGSGLRSATFQASGNASGVAALPEVVDATTGHLIPCRPTDVVLDENWRAAYGNKSVDQTGHLASDKIRHGVTMPSDSGQAAEDEDLWAQMDETAHPEESGQDPRPVSSFPVYAAEDHLANAGITYDQLASYQDQLVRSASNQEMPPPLPTTPANQVIPSLAVHNHSPSVVSNGVSPFQDCSAEHSHSPARGPDPHRSFDAQGPPRPVQGSVSSRSSRQGFGERNNLASLVSPASSSTHGTPRAMKSEVMYDVTTSHRPTSPPPAAAQFPSTGLPTLVDLSASLSEPPKRESMSMLQAVEQAGPASMSPTHHRSWHDTGSLHHASDALDHQSIASGAIHPETSEQVTTSWDASRPQYDLDRSSSDYARQTQYGPNGGTLAEPSSQSTQHYDSPSMKTIESLGIPRSSSHNVEHNNHLLHSPSSPQTAWSVPVGLQETEAGQGYLHPARNQLIDDVAAQARAATRALKGIDDGSAPTPPFRTKAIARKKSFRKVSKQISSPQLISTTQRMDHVVDLVGPEALPKRVDSLKASQHKGPPWAGKEGETIPDVPALPGKVRRPTGAAHRRRSSSFGHSAQVDGSDWLQQGVTGASTAPPDMTLVGASPATSPAASPHPQSEAAVQRPGQHLTIGMGKSSSSNGSLSRLMSKIRSRKASDVVTTIEPFPPSPSNSAFANSLSPTTLPSMSPIQPSRSPSLWRSPEPKDDHTQSPTIASPVSSTYPQSLPRIDSTAMPGGTGKKYKTPIMLKRESEVRLPGDLDASTFEGSTVTPVEPSPESEAADVPSMPLPDSTDTNAPQSDLAKFWASEPSGGLLTTFSASSNLIQNRWEADTAAASTLAEGQADAHETVKKRDSKAATTSPSADLPNLQSAPSLNSAVSDTNGSRSLAAVDSEAPAAPNRDVKRKADQRKSLRDTIVRRTIIIPTDFNFDERRKSAVSTTSRRKSRKPAPFSPDEMPWNTSMNPSSSSASVSRADDFMASKDSTASFGTALPPRSFARTSTPPDASTASRQSEFAPDNALPTLPSSASAAMSTLNSQQSLAPSSTTTSMAAGHNRMSRLHSSYAGSLYDMYVGDDGSDVQGGLSEDGRSRSSRLFVADGGDRNSRMPEARRHIEVTERADGSVVWQVVAGLADRGSVYSDYGSRHSHSSSNGYMPQDRESLLLPGFNNRDSMLSESYSELEMAKTPAGLTHEDSRSFFARPRGHRKSFSFDASLAPPMPSLPKPAATRSRASSPSAVTDASRSDGVSSARSTEDVTMGRERTRSQAVFEMATTSAHQDDDEAVEPTRIVYHNDAQLASLLDLLARGKDSAKFEFQAAHHAGGGGGPSRPVSTWAKSEGNETLDAEDIESHRSRVEAEIYTLLNPQSPFALQR
ncbi:hypothetical protein ACQY0O_000209 [Thecaphora frezii]